MQDNEHRGMESLQAAGAPAPPPHAREDVGHRALADAIRVSFRFLRAGMLILLVVYLMRGWFYVPRDRIAIRLRFGRPMEVNLGPGRGRGYVADSGSGWQFAWPWDDVVWLPLEQQTLLLDTEFMRGGRAGSEAVRRDDDGYLSLHRDHYLITGDVNLIHMPLRVRYRVRSDQQGAFDYAFRLKAPEDILRRMAVSATIETVGTWEVLEVRRKRKEVGTGPALSLYEEIENRTRAYIRRFEDSNGYSIGLELVSVEPVQDPEVPAEVRPAFDRALDAESRKDALIQEARREATGIVAAAAGERAEILGRAASYRTRIVSSAEADREMLERLLPLYRHSPERAAILREWHYGRMIQELLGRAEGSFILHGDSSKDGRELWLQFEPPRPGARQRDP